MFDDLFPRVALLSELIIHEDTNIFICGISSGLAHQTFIRLFPKYTYGRSGNDLHNQIKTFSMSLTMGFLYPYSNIKLNLKIHWIYSIKNYDGL